MEIQYSEKAKFFKPNIFNILNERKAKIAQKGVKVYDLFVGTPDFPPAEHVMKVVQEAALNPENYKYSLTDTQELKDAVKNWYDRRYDVTLNDDEIMSINCRRKVQCFYGKGCKSKQCGRACIWY